MLSAAAGEEGTSSPTSWEAAGEPGRARVREAVDTGASVLAVACPNCAKMLEDAAKAENLEGKIAVKEIRRSSREPHSAESMAHGVKKKNTKLNHGDRRVRRGNHALYSFPFPLCGERGG